MPIAIALEWRHGGPMCLPGWHHARAAVGYRRQDRCKLSLCTDPEIQSNAKSDRECNDRSPGGTCGLQ